MKYADLLIHMPQVFYALLLALLPGLLLDHAMIKTFNRLVQNYGEKNINKTLKQNVWNL